MKKSVPLATLPADTQQKSPQGSLVSENGTTPAPVQKKKRRRLSKAFSYPLDKILKNGDTPTHQRFSLSHAEHEHLVALKQRLGNLGIRAKKGQLIRLGLNLLAEKSDNEIECLLKALPEIQKN